MHPQTIYGHVVATAENFTGLLLLAVMTGLVFARFSRPRARIIFAKYPVVTKHNGVTTLIFRMANARSNFITEATAKLWVLSPTVTEEGKRLVGFEQMRLLRSENPTFALSWTLFHPIDDQSPLFGKDEETLAASQMNFVVSIVGFDETSGQIVRARDVFAAQDVRFGHEYVDFVWVDDQGLRHIDYAKIDATRPVSPDAGSADDKPSLKLRNGACGRRWRGDRRRAAVTPFFRKVANESHDNDYMLQINNMLHALAEAKHSLNEIMKSAIALPAMSRVNNDNNVGACRKVVSWDWGIRTR